MYLRICESPYLYDSDKQEVIYSNDNDHTYLENSSCIVIDKYICLFDSDYRIVDEAWQYFQNRLLVKRHTFNSLIAKGRDLKLFYDFLDEYRLRYKKIKHKHINDFIAWLMLPDKDDSLMQLKTTSKRTAKTVNRILSSVQDFYNFHESVNELSNPFKFASETIKYPTRQNKSFYAHTQSGLVQKSIFKVKEFNNGVRVLTKEQYDMILENCTMQRDKLLFKLLMLTGMRIGEALSLEIHSIGVLDSQFNVQTLNMTPNNEDNYKGNRYRQQKGGVRDLFIPSSLMDDMNKYYESKWLKIYEEKEMLHEYFFISEAQNKGEPLSYQTVWNRCNVISKKVGFKFTPHDFRHTFATYLARNKVGIDKLKKLLGHTHIASTDIYIQIANQEDIMNELIPFYEGYGL